MEIRYPHVFNIASDAPFLDTLAFEILKGFPLYDEGLPLSDLQVLVPTRRAARELELKLLTLSGRCGLVLPTIRPIGDVDEDILEISGTDLRLPNAISSMGRQFVIVALIDKWAAENSHLPLARVLSESPLQAQLLAVSLSDLIDSLETEEISLDRLPEAYSVDLASHRESLLGLLGLIRLHLPQRLHEAGVMGSRERRSRLIHLEVQRLKESPTYGPIIAAGSTGTIPATRALLKAIAQHDKGAIILPGLDQGMDDESWSHVTAQHPQFALKQLIEDLDIPRGTVALLGRPAGIRAWIASEMMRPSEVADKWHSVLTGQRPRMREGLQGVFLHEAGSKTEEASLIAAVMRQELERPSGDVALVTPDRDLARRVRVALLRWNIEVDDSAGEPLIQVGAAAFLSLLMEAVNRNFDAVSLNALFNDPHPVFGMERSLFRRVAQNIDLVLFRDQPMGSGLAGFRSAYMRCAAARGTQRRHQLVSYLSDDDWRDMRACVERVVAFLSPLMSTDVAPLADHLTRIVKVAADIAGDALWGGPEAEVLQSLLSVLEQESLHYPPCHLDRATLVFQQALASVAFRRPRERGPRLAILGLLEARLLSPQTVILGGLNEGKWPRQPDAGPWLNRPMRDLFAMPQPERQIGQMAHDFVQCFGASRVYLTSSRRDGVSPAISSRWLLRLQTIMKAGDVRLDTSVAHLANWVTALDTTENTRALHMPKPTPPVAARPRRLSVTRVERLIRDPYAIYAQYVLGLEPLPDVSTRPSAALRGTLFHAALGDFFSQNSGDMPIDIYGELIKQGRKYFDPYSDSQEISSFWWTRFQRIARWIANNEHIVRGSATTVSAEVDGVLDMTVGETPFQLTARADRIDIHPDGTSHIIDFKSGSPPSSKAVEAGFSPQLTLEAAMLERGAFSGLGRHPTRDLTYIRVSGGIPAGEIKPVNVAAMDLAGSHLANLTSLLLAYQNKRQAYLPRFGMQREDDISEFDHLSRYWEWILAGDMP